jgi:hypothetical protein
MTRTAYLRVYQPLSAFPRAEQELWRASEAQLEGSLEPVRREWLLASSLRGLDLVPTEGAFVRKVDGQVLVCPWRTRLRMLVGLLSFRGSVPDEVAEAFVPEQEARRAAYELARLEEEHPEVRSHIVHANWHVPLRWFSAFDEGERILTEDRYGLRVRYETSLSKAHARLERALRILEGSWIDGSVTEAVRGLLGWIGEFSEVGLLELDYGTVSGIFEDDELVEDVSAAEVWACLEALEAGDVVKAGRIFAELTERWTEVRATEVVN